MNGKELIARAIRREPVERVPWVPFVGVHGGYLLGVTATEYLKSSALIVEGTNEAIKRYKPDGIPVAFDLQVEAEALGCQLVWADENPPAVVSHPLVEGKTLNDLHIPELSEGRIGIFIDAAKQLRAAHPDIALYGLITGPFTLALHLLGTEIFMKMFMDEDEINRILDFTKQVCKQMASYYIEAGCDVVAVVDPMTSQIGSDQFKQFVSQPATEIFEFIRQRGRFGSFFVCGHAQQNIEVMCQCKPDNISIDENIPLDFVREIALKHNVSFGGNLKLTVVLLMGTPEECQINALECLDIGGKTGFILAPGCDMPRATPPENVEAISKLVHDPYQQDIIRTIDRTPVENELLNMRDYGNTNKVIVDIITLDSESCAPCQYMVEAVKAIAPQFEGIVEWREHSIKNIKAVTFMSSLYVKNIPTICIDGQIKFVSRIPPKQKLIEAIQERILEKLRYRIKVRKGEILIFGKTEEECRSIMPQLAQAMEELGTDIKITHITDNDEMMAYGVTSTPAIVVADYSLKSQGTLPSSEVIKEWLKPIV